MALIKDISGNRYGSLVCLRLDGKKCHQSMYLCACDCGITKRVGRQDLVAGKVVSCGCKKKKRTHGLSRSNGKKTKLYSVWSAMLDRCRNKNNHAYDRYGGRGINVCEEWYDYKKFYEWANAHGYCEGLTIERKDNNGNYCPENCAWIPQEKQPTNTGRVILLEMDGESHTLKEWSDILGIKKDTIRGRLRSGMNIKTALTKEIGR